MMAECRAAHSMAEARLPALDGIRGMAVLAVLVVHAQILLNPERPIEHAMIVLSEFGAYGVDLFFVLSGFLITGILLDTRESANYFRTFYARRFLRLFPVYYGYLFAVAFIFPALHHALHISMTDFHGQWLWYLSYLSNWKAGHGASDPFLEHFWSLGVEEQFYLWWPALIFLVPRRRLVLCFVTIIAIAVLLRWCMAYQGVFWNTLYRLTPTRMDSLGLGALVALTMRVEPWRLIFARVSNGVMTLSAGMFCLLAIAGRDISWKSRLIQTAGSLGIEVAFACIVFGAAVPGENWIKRIGTTAWLRIFGKYSYTIYVIHVAVYSHLVWLISWASQKKFVPMILPVRITYILIMITVVFYLASLSWRYVEGPLLALKKRFTY